MCLAVLVGSGALEGWSWDCTFHPFVANGMFWEKVKFYLFSNEAVCTETVLLVLENPVPFRGKRQVLGRNTSFVAANTARLCPAAWRTGARLQH